MTQFLADAIDSVLEGEGAPPGAALAVSASGHRAAVAGGVAQSFDERGPLSVPPPMDENVISDVGSLTKVLATTASLMSLVDDGLALESPLASCLPAARSSPAGEVTLEDLLRHRGGLWEWWPLYLEAGRREQALAGAASLPLRYPAGSGAHYSDLGFMLLGAVVEALGQARLEVVVQERVLRPLGLARVSFASPVPDSVVAASSLGDRIERKMVETGHPYPVPVSPSFDRWRSHVLVGEVNDGNAFHAFAGVAGHAGLFAPATDLLTFAEGLLSSGTGTRPFARAVVARFLAPGPDPERALGFRLWPEIGAAGHLGFPGVGLAVVPERDLAVVLVTNRLHVRGGFPRPTDQLFRIALRAALRWEAGAAWS